MYTGNLFFGYGCSIYEKKKQSTATSINKLKSKIKKSDNFKNQIKMNHYCPKTSFPPMLVHGVNYNGHQHVLVIFRKNNQNGVLNNNIFSANGIQFDSDTVSIDKRRRMNTCVCLFPKTRHSYIALTPHELSTRCRFWPS